MLQYRRIYFDMDGVLADFNKAATRVEKITGRLTATSTMKG